MTLYLCHGCKQHLLTSQFTARRRSKSTSRGVPDRCKVCRAADARQARRDNPQPTRDNDRRRSQRALFTSRLKVKYGITVEDFARMFEAQDRKCACCRERLGGPGPETHVDHCHSTGRVRAILCRSCNQTVGILKESAERARLVAEYIERVCYVQSNGVVHVVPVPIIRGECVVEGRLVR